MAKLLGGLAAVIPAAVLLAGCNKHEGAAKEQKFDYPAPRYLRALVNPTPQELLDGARRLVRQQYGLSALGKAQKGWTISVFVPYGEDLGTFEALKKAWAERGVEAHIVQPWDVSGETKAAFTARLEAAQGIMHGSEGFKEVAHFDPSYYKYLPPEAKKQSGGPVEGIGFLQFAAVAKYLDEHPEVQHFYAAPGGSVNAFCVPYPEHCKKMIGNWTYINSIDITNHANEYPGDLWNLVEEVIARPAQKVSEGTITDPEGTNVHWTMSPAQTLNWASYVRTPVTNNHLFLYPNPNDATTMEGVVASTANHVGFMPYMKATLDKHGKPIKVEGGGLHGKYVRDLFANKQLNTLPDGKPVCIPGMPECGYWFLGTDGYATNPKKVRNYYTLTGGSSDLTNVWERERGGVMHMSFVGINILNEKEKDVEEAIRKKTPVGMFNADPRAFEYAHKNGLPVGHTAHFHLYFPTVKWRMRDTGEWITISDKGRPVAYDNPEVRALASKYGDPDAIFSFDWVPGIPGVNMPGDEEAFKRDPWSWVAKEWDEMKKGTYAYFVENYQMLKVLPGAK